MRPSRPTTDNRSGMTLIEVMVAVAILASMGALIYSGLVLNERGIERAIAAGLGERLRRETATRPPSSGACQTSKSPPRASVKHMLPESTVPT